MSHVGSVQKRQQVVQEEEVQHLYANRVRVYPKAVSGIVRQTKWAILIVCLSVYYLLPWLRWDRGPGRPTQALLLDLWHERLYIFWMEFWPQEIYLLVGVLVTAAIVLNGFVERPRESLAGFGIVLLGLPAYFWMRRRRAEPEGAMASDPT